MKSTCPICKRSLYLPEDHQSLRKWQVICSHCYSLYQAESGVVIGAWLGFSRNHQNIYLARIQMRTGSIKTVEIDQLIGANIPIILMMPAKGVGHLQPILLVDAKTNQSHFLPHPQRQFLKYQRYTVIGVSIFILCLGLSIWGGLATIIIVAVVGGLLVGNILPRVLRSRQHNSKTQNRLMLEQRLIRQSDAWGEQLQQLEIELTKLHQANKRLLPYSQDEVFHIRSISDKPRKRQYFQSKYYRLSELVECYVLAKNLIDINIPIIQLAEEVPADLISQLSNLSLQIKDLERRYQSMT